MYKIRGKHAIAAIKQNRKNYSIKDDYVLVNDLFYPTELDTIIEKYTRILLIDNMTDIRNIGSVIRSAAILGYAVLLREKCRINEITVECASGGIDNTAICYIKNVSEIIRKLKNSGFWLVALDENGMDKQLELDKIVLVIGSEGDGLSSIIKRECDILYKINSSGKMKTFNAAIAASIAMYNL